MSLITSAFVGVSTAASAAPGDPFNPADPQVFVAQNSPTQLFRAVSDASGTVNFAPEGPPSPATYNAISYRTADNYIYGVVNGGTPGYPQGTLLRIGQNGSITPIASGLGATISAAFGPQGAFYYITDEGLNRFNVVTGNHLGSVPITGASQSADMAYKDGFFWTMTGSTITRMDPATGVVVGFPVAGVETSGAAWTYGNGNLGFSANASGNVFQVAVDNPASAEPTIRILSVVSGPGSTNNDGAASPGLPTDFGIVKEGPESITAGGQVTYTLTVTNNGQGNSSGYTVTDAVPAGLTNVQATSTANCTVAGNDVTCVGGRMLAGASSTITITADVPADIAECVTNTAYVLGNEQDPNPDNNSSEVTSCPRGLDITKSSDATAETRVGDTVTYTVTATNTGVADFTADEPAVISDDLGGVLDDATYNDDAVADQTGDLTFTSPRLKWTGALAAGETVEITYSVTLTAAGDGYVRNVAFPNDPVNTPDCVDGADPTTGLQCATTETLLPRLQIMKTADVTDLPAIGSPVTYTVTVTNAGPGDFTEENPATATDSWGEVIDDADIADGSPVASTGTLVTDEDGFAWDGVLLSGESATITATFTYNGEGDQKLTNQACVPTNLLAPGATPCVTVEIPGSGLSYTKTSDPATGTIVRAGEEITYSLIFTNTGNTPATVDATDDLAEVLDDAELTSAPVSSNAAVTPTVDGTDLLIAGTLPVGETAVVTYTATVLSFDQQGDHLIGNVLSDTGGVCADACETEHPVEHLTIQKTSDAVAGVNTGDTVEYTVTVVNDGGTDFTADNPAIATDDLSGVLDDAEFDGNATSTVGGVEYAEPVLTWSGPLEAGDSASFTYSLLVTNAGDHNLVNVASTPVCVEAEDCTVTVETPLPHIVSGKTSDPESGTGLGAGDVVTYALTFTNDGLAAGPVDSTDDLSDVLDDAELTSAPVSDNPSVTVTNTEAALRIVGELEPGQTATVTYQVTIRPDGERGNNVSTNLLLQDTPAELIDCVDGECVTPPPPSTEHPIGELDDSKAVNPASGTTLRPGATATYTLTFTNTGKADVDVNRQDVLTGVLDDADLTSPPVASDPALTVSDLVDGRVTITGTLAAGETVTVSYEVTVRGDGERGDDQLGNFLVNTGGEPPASCEVGNDDCTMNYVSDISVLKSSNPDSGTKVLPGDEVTYTLTFKNLSSSSSAADVSVDYTDHMADVLDDASLTNGPTVKGTVAAKADGNSILITGALASGSTATVTYTVTVGKYNSGNNNLGNVVAMTGAEPICADNSPLCTSHFVSAPPAAPSVPGLPVTGATLGTLVGLALLLLGGGAALMVARRRQAEMS
ncbi:DUF11 domain-containing protein [Leucobacter manosquensis]|uniref:DUF11 domain-containing protein n=1 Tax=Leucobacter manosquensis TaxID=2810611 RepID=A0ABS5M8W5_9MICO|nr:DUF11 domain-containing protein [Leucobacter manosquensis]MBS3183468.1 DUF11 domain-containing protein [Leucobacter manosquensis]